MREMRVSSAVFFEDLRQEISGKFMLIGVVGPSLAIGQIPGRISLGLFLEIQPAEIGNHEIDFRVTGLGEPAPVSGKLNVHIDELQPFVMPLGPFPIPITSEGVLQFQWRVAAAKWETIKTMSITLNADLMIGAPQVISGSS